MNSAGANGIDAGGVTCAALLFDLDGTLTDPKPGITRAVQHALARMGIVEPDLERLTRFIGPPLIPSFQRYYGLDLNGAQRALEYYREYFAETGLYENAVYPGVPELLAELRARGRRLILATSKPSVYAERILAHFGLARHFEFVAGATLDETRATKADVIAFALAEVPGLAPARCVMVGDHAQDVLGARANGIAAIAVTYGYGVRAELEAAQPAQLVPSVDALSRLLLGSAPDRE